MDEGTVIMSGLNKSRVIESVQIAASHNSEVKRSIKPIKDYEADNVSKKFFVSYYHIQITLIELSGIRNKNFEKKSLGSWLYWTYWASSLFLSRSKWKL
jgi:hypothetical protein